MKKYYLTFLLILIILIGGVIFLLGNTIKTYILSIQENINTSNPVSQPVVLKYKYINKDGINIIIGNFDIDLFKSPDNELLSPKELGIQSSSEVVINGGYFGTDKSYIGLYWDGINQLGKLSAGNQQATHIAIFDKINKKLSFEDSSDFNETDFSKDANHIYFQSGPIIIDNNELQTSFIDRSLNGNQSSLRSFLGYTEQGEMFVGVTTKGYDLRELGNKLMSKGFFENQAISVINLDGGSSTALYSRENSEVSYRDFKEVPYLIEFK